MQDLSSLTKDQTCAPAVETQSLNHWTAREVPPSKSLLNYIRLLREQTMKKVEPKHGITEDFPDGLVGKTPCSQGRGPRFES